MATRTSERRRRMGNAPVLESARTVQRTRDGRVSFELRVREKFGSGLTLN
jgi:hypothetical protein